MSALSTPLFPFVSESPAPPWAAAARFSQRSPLPAAGGRSLRPALPAFRPQRAEKIAAGHHRPLVADRYPMAGPPAGAGGGPRQLYAGVRTRSRGRRHDRPGRLRAGRHPTAPAATPSPSRSNWRGAPAPQFSGAQKFGRPQTGDRPTAGRLRSLPHKAKATPAGRRRGGPGQGRPISIKGRPRPIG